nr:metallophosphoesterase [Moraxella sp. CTOTU48268]
MNKPLKTTLFLSITSALLLTGCKDNNNGKSNVLNNQNNNLPEVAFMADVHFHDVYGDLKNSNFQGIPTAHGNATIRTMYAQLTSTRLFNENYFAFRAALDDALSKGIKFVAFPGDYSDDGQPMNVEGFRKVLQEYEKKGMRFFIAPGNHDPVSPDDNETAGKSDFMGLKGQPQKVYALKNAACLNSDPTVVCTNQMMEQGYDSLTNALGDYGLMPSTKDVYWETPYSTYNENNYNFNTAKQQAAITQRQYEICKEGEGGVYKQANYSKCAKIPDVSYLVEPVKGLWLLSVDANVFVPTDKFDPNNPKAPGGFTGAGGAGWNKMVTHKKTTMKWIASVVERAKKENKKLVAFSHYPSIEFYANQTGNIQSTFGDKTFQTERVPSSDATAQVAATGLPLHIGGHMHSNSTNDYKDSNGNYLVNVQSPSLAVYGAAYKVVKFDKDDKVNVKTVPLDNVPRFNELFPLYKMEHDYIMANTQPSDPTRWNVDILNSKNYRDFTHFYFGQLSQLRFMGEYWPCDMRDLAQQLNMAQMLTMTQLSTQATYAQLPALQATLNLKASNNCLITGSQTSTITPEQFALDWKTAETKASALATAEGLTMDDLAKISPYDFYGDFHRTIYAGQLALQDIGDKRVKAYKLLMKSFPASPTTPLLAGGKLSTDNPINVPFQYKFKHVFEILKGVGSGKPSNNFVVDYRNKTLTETSNTQNLSFN